MNFLPEWRRRRAYRKKRRELETGKDQAWEASEKKIKDAKEFNEKQFHLMEQFDEMCQFERAIQGLDSREMVKRAEKCHVALSDFPLPVGETSHWEEDETGLTHIREKTLRDFTKAVEDAEHERAKRKIELNDYKIKVATVILAAVAALASILNLVMGNKH